MGNACILCELNDMHLKGDAERLNPKPVNKVIIRTPVIHNYDKQIICKRYRSKTLC